LTFPRTLGHTQPRRVLVVDDDGDILEFIRGVLEDEGLTVQTASDGAQAVELSEEFGPDLMILDATLPVLSSHRVATLVRDVRGREFPVLVITADGQAVAKARRLGAYAYLRKPFDLNHLVDAVWDGLRRVDGDLI
jgi:DNA-binding response OmpR family regulator